MDIEFMTNEEIDPVSMVQYLMEQHPKQTKKEIEERALKNRQLGDGS